jgi:transposase
MSCMMQGLGVSWRPCPSPSVTLWLDRCEQGGVEALPADRPRSGPPKRITPAAGQAIVERTLRTAPPAAVATHWSTRLMA